MSIMQNNNRIDKTCLHYLRQMFCIVITLIVSISFTSLLLHVSAIVAPLIVGSLFAIITEVADILIWHKVNRTNKDMLTTFFMAMSGCRFLLVLAILLVCYIAVGRDAMLNYCVVVLLFYFAIMTHHSLFFTHILNSHNECDSQKK